MTNLGLQDPKIQEMIHAMRENPQKGAACMMQAKMNPDLNAKVKVLIQNGLLAVQSF